MYYASLGYYTKSAETYAVKTHARSNGKEDGELYSIGWCGYVQCGYAPCKEDGAKVQ
jgi:hypothetical protein